MVRIQEISTEKGFDRFLVDLTEELFNLELERMDVNAILEKVQSYAPAIWKNKHPRILDAKVITKHLPDEEDDDEEQEAEDE